MLYTATRVLVNYNSLVRECAMSLSMSVNGFVQNVFTMMRNAVKPFNNSQLDTMDYQTKHIAHYTEYIQTQATNFLAVERDAKFAVAFADHKAFAATGDRFVLHRAFFAGDLSGENNFELNTDDADGEGKGKGKGKAVETGVETDDTATAVATASAAIAVAGIADHQMTTLPDTTDPDVAVISGDMDMLDLDLDTNPAGEGPSNYR